MTAYPTPSQTESFLAAPFSALRRIMEGLRAKRVREETAHTYSRLLEADDHILSDLGVTRLEVLHLLQELQTR